MNYICDVNPELASDDYMHENGMHMVTANTSYEVHTHVYIIYIHSSNALAKQRT